MPRWKKRLPRIDPTPGDPVLAGEAVELAPELSALPAVHAVLARLLATVVELGLAEADDPALHAFHTAAVEIATNIMRHAYPPPQPRRPFRLQLQLYAGRIEAHFADAGIEYVPHAQSPALPVTDDVLDLPEGGFGLFLARQSLDELDYTRSESGINHWRLVKRLTPVGTARD